MKYMGLVTDRSWYDLLDDKLRYVYVSDGLPIYFERTKHSIRRIYSDEVPMYKDLYGGLLIHSKRMSLGIYNE